MYRLSDLSSERAAPAWLVLALSAFESATQIDFLRRTIGGNDVNVTGLFALGAVIWLLYVVVRGRNYRQKTATMLSDLSNYGLNQLLHLNVDQENDFHKWLERYGVWQADVQPGLFHTDPERNWWKSMMSEKLDRLDQVTDQVVGK